MKTRWVSISIASAVIVTLATFHIASCVRLDRSVATGTIVAKVYRPAHPHPLVIGGKTPVVIVTQIPDEYFIEIEGTDANGNARRIEQGLSKEEYDRD